MTERCLADFEGAWRLVREIAHGNGTMGRFEGRARFAPRAGGLDYVEEGQLSLDAGAPLTATQRYFWDAELAVFFEDGRFFHHVPRAGGETAHWCAPDQYDGHYGFENWPAFSVTWRVLGPRKDYTTVSRYVR